MKVFFLNVYLDNASTTFPKPSCVADSIYNFITNIGGNSNRSNHSNALESNRLLYNARENVCKLFNFNQVENVIFTNNISTSLNMLILGLLSKGDHVITTSMEHNSVLRPITFVKENKDVEVDIINASPLGFINVSSIEKAIKPNTKLVVLSYASNVTGSIQQIKAIGKLCKEKNIFFIVDSAQAAGVISIDFNDINADAIAFTGHKSLLGPQGTGGFIINDKLNNECKSIITGGTGSASHSLHQPTFLPDKFETGTHNLPGIVGLSSSLDFIFKIGIEEINSKNKFLLSKLVNGILNIEGLKFYGDSSLKNITTCVSLNYKNIDPSEVSFYLEENGIKNRSGLHCAPLAHKTIGTFPTGTVRLSISYFNTEEEIDYTLKVLNNLSREFC